MDFLSTLLSSNGLPKILRLFIFNPEKIYSKADIIERSRVVPENVQFELSLLLRANIIKRKSAGGKRGALYMLNEKFEYLTPLRTFLVDTLDLTDRELVTRLSSAGRIRMVVVAGVFQGIWDARVDLLIIGERLNATKLAKIVRELEAQMGHDLHYSHFEPADFKYRLSLNDRLLRDVFDFPHRVVIDKLDTR